MRSSARSGELARGLGTKVRLRPDIITWPRATAGYAPLGAMIVSDRLAEPFQDEDVAFLHGSPGRTPASCAVSLKSSTFSR